MLFFEQAISPKTLAWGWAAALLGWFWPMATMAQSQPLQELARRLIPLQKLPEDPYSVDNYVFLPALERKAKQLPRFFRPKTGCDFTEPGHYLPINLDADGQLDVIYSGICAPYDHTVIFLNQKGRMVKLANEQGRLMSVSQRLAGSIVDIFKQGCCCDYLNQQTTLVIGQQGSLARHVIYFHRNTQVMVEDIKEIMASGKLRPIPSESNETIEDLCDINEKELQEFPTLTNTKVVQLRRQGDWALVVYALSGQESWLGWAKVID
jgi:hypothetical protein